MECSTATVALPSDILYILAGVCDKEKLFHLRLVSRHFEAICRPFLYHLLVQEIDSCFHLHRAAAICLEAGIQGLLAAGAPTMHHNTAGETALHVAARGNCIVGVKRLLLAKANVNSQTHSGWTPLQLAARYGHDKLVGILLENGADPNVRGFHGWTALHYAARSGHIAVVKRLVKGRARVDIIDNDGRKAMDEARDFGHATKFLGNQPRSIKDGST